MAFFLKAVWAVQLVVELFALVLLTRRRMYRFYPALVAYLAVSFLDDGIGLSYDPHSAAYANFWFYSETLMLGLKGVLVWELIRKMIERYQGIGSFTGSLLVFVVGASVLLCTFTMSPELHAAPWRLRRYQLFFMYERWSMTALAGVIGLLAIFFVVYRSSRKPNVLVHQWTTLAYLAGNAGTAFWAEFTNHREFPSLLLQAVDVVCFLAWAQLSPRGESEAVLPPGFSIETVGKLLGNSRSEHLSG